MPGGRRLWAFVAIWVATRALILVEVGFWHHSGHYRLEDVNTYSTWSDQLAGGSLPSGHAWQYPSGAAFLFLLPRLGFGNYGETFVGLMLVFDLVALGLLVWLGREREDFTGAWVWLLGLPLIGVFSVLRFDLVPTVFAIAALVVIHRRPQWFGALAGVGAAVKVWPVVLLLGEWDRRRLVRATLAAAAAVAVVLVAAALAFGDPLGFLGAQGGRGLQEEAVASAPWQLEQLVTGVQFHRALEYGAWQIDTPGARSLAGVLEWLTLAALAAAAYWWWLRRRAIEAGATELAGADVSRDFVFTLVLLLVVTSRVLSPQYMVWLLGLAAVVLSAGTTRLARPAWIVVGATILTTATFRSPANTLVRDLALLVAAVDASVAMARSVRRGAGRGS